MAARLTLPPLYPILDAGLLAAAGISIESFARELYGAGIRFLQYRDKNGSDREVMERAAMLRRIFPAPESLLILNDRVRLCREAGFDGVHLGQEDMAPAETRLLLGRAAIVGLSTHNPGQLTVADTTDADYLAIGPVFATASKQNPDPVVGLAGVREARSLTAKPLVAIGGITAARCRAVIEAGADSVAVVAGLLPGPERTARQAAEEFARLLARTRE